MLHHEKTFLNVHAIGERHLVRTTFDKSYGVLFLQKTFIHLY